MEGIGCCKWYPKCTMGGGNLVCGTGEVIKMKGNKMKKKIILQLAFLEGEIDIDPAEATKGIVIPLICTQEKVDGKLMTIFDTTNNILFKETKDQRDGKPIFKPESITLTL